MGLGEFGYRRVHDARTSDNLSNIIAPLNIRRDDPKNFAGKVFDFLQIHGSSQLEDISKSNLFALHVKAHVNDARVDVNFEELERRFGNNHSREREDQVFKHLKNIKGVFEIYEQVQKFQIEESSPLDLWIKINSALMLKFYLEGTEISALEYAGLEEEEDVYKKHAAQDLLIGVYSERIQRFGDESEVASRWLDRFNRKLYEEICMPYMLNAKMIKSTEEFEAYQRPHIFAMLKQAKLDIASEMRE